jgi:hypothetical protein
VTDNNHNGRLDRFQEHNHTLSPLCVPTFDLMVFMLSAGADLAWDAPHFRTCLNKILGSVSGCHLGSYAKSCVVSDAALTGRLPL